MAERAGRRGNWRRRLVRAGVVGLVLLLGALPVVNLVLQIGAVRGVLERRLGTVTGSPVEVGNASYWPWSGVELERVVIGDGGRLPGRWEIASVEVDLEMRSLLGGDLRVPQVRLVRPVGRVEWERVQPVVVAAVGGGGDRPMPEQRPGTSGAASAGAPPAIREPEPAEKIEATGEAVAGDGKRTARRVILGRVEVVEGAVRLGVPGVEDPLFEGGGIGVDLDFAGGRGELSLGRAELLGGKLAGEGIRGGLVTDGGVVQLEGMSMPLGGGRIEFDGRVVPAGGGVPFEGRLRAAGIELGEVEGLGLEGFSLSGVFGGEATIAGYGSAVESWRGRGAFKIEELGVSGGGTGVTLTPAEIEGTLQGGWINLERFYAHSDKLALRASGGAVADGRLGVNLRVYVDRAVAAAVAKRLEMIGGGVRPSGMRELEGTHYAYRDVAVRGTLAQPALILWEGAAPVSPADFLNSFTPDGAVLDPFLAQ